MCNKVTCIICPKSCTIKSKKTGNEIMLTGDSCVRGRKYAILEIKDPRRIFTSTVLLKDSDLKAVPVRTTRPIKKNEWVKAKKAIDELILDAPVKFHSIIVKDFLEKGIDLIATREVIKSNG